jgi:hypothetical protein
VRLPGIRIIAGSLHDFDAYNADISYRGEREIVISERTGRLLID